MDLGRDCWGWIIQGLGFAIFSFNCVSKGVNEYVKEGDFYRRIPEFRCFFNFQYMAEIRNLPNFILDNDRILLIQPNFVIIGIHFLIDGRLLSGLKALSHLVIDPSVLDQKDNTINSDIISSLTTLQYLNISDKSRVLDISRALSPLSLLKNLSISGNYVKYYSLLSLPSLTHLSLIYSAELVHYHAVPFSSVQYLILDSDMFKKVYLFPNLVHLTLYRERLSRAIDRFPSIGRSPGAYALDFYEPLSRFYNSVECSVSFDLPPSFSLWWDGVDEWGEYIHSFEGLYVHVYLVKKPYFDCMAFMLRSHTVVTQYSIEKYNRECFNYLRRDISFKSRVF
jgi:hypothetical protein